MKLKKPTVIANFMERKNGQKPHASSFFTAASIVYNQVYGIFRRIFPQSRKFLTELNI